MTDQDFKKASSHNSLTVKEEKESGPFINLICNIVLPVFLLNNLSKYFGERGPLFALLIALSLPIALGLYDYIKVKKRNFISLLGIINILLTGGLALYKLEGIWFAVKEAAVPLVIGLAVLFSVYSKRSLIEVLIFNEKIMKVDLIREKLLLTGKELAFKAHLKKSTILLSFSFFLSAFLNFVLAKRIFINLDPLLGEREKALLLNDQIAQMTWQSYVVILIPSFIFMAFILWYLLKGIKENTGLEIQEILKTQ